ncbi:MAG: SET domain-containing protein-lysine N-methyltransferase [Thiotrichaceae bacterium]|nr:SET domain-containing protein-lysine N-methyltransferase [Thiotrichaceae bacterium]
MTPQNEKNTLIQDVANKGRGVFAKHDFKQGDLVIVGKRIDLIDERTMTSLQVTPDKHAELDEPARVTNHSCDPNLGIKSNELGGYNFYALQNITQGTELTWDYNTTEYHSIAVPECHCGSTNCRGKTPGFVAIEDELRTRYGEYIADYLKGSA